MKIVIIYVGYSGYFCSCCRALAARKNVVLKVYARKPKVPFSKEVIQGVPLIEKTDIEYDDYNCFSQEVLAESPDAIIIPGWDLPVANRMLRDRRFDAIKFLSIIDTSWEASPRQILARFALHWFVRRINAIIVGGERGRMFARWIGFPQNKIFISAYGIDFKLFSATELPKLRNKSFLYAARYVKQKGIAVLLKAYKLYRNSVADPWPLNCFGAGELRGLFCGCEGVYEHGFAQPSELPKLYSENGVYVLPSMKEPWGVSLAEAAAGGMPLICSHMVTSGVDVARHLANALVFPAGDVDALSRCLSWCHHNYSRLEEMGAFSREYAKAYASEVWAERIEWAIKSCV